jgi:hypothetical protein
MLFQTLDSKQDCIGVYINEELFFDERVLHDFKGTRTWSYASYLEGRDVEYAYLYCGARLDKVCPDSLRSDWEFVNTRLQAFMRSFIEAKVSLNDNCFFDLVPEKLLRDYCYMKNKICNFVFETYERPANYDYLLATNKLLHKIAFQRLKLSPANLRAQMHRKGVRETVRKLRNIEPYCKYNLFGTKTGRLTTKKNSFPILTLAKEMRSILEPRNDIFVGFDFNGAELRTFMALGGSEQPVEDVHLWNLHNVYRKIGSREKAKKRIFSWLYNPDSKDHLSSRAYDREGVLNKYWDGTAVSTVYGRSMKVEERKALNYLIQSTTSDMVMEQAVKLDEMLEPFESCIAFVIHDEVVLDMNVNEMHLLPRLKETFSQTRFGNYLVNAKEGSDFGIAA